MIQQICAKTTNYQTQIKSVILFLFWPPAGFLPKIYSLFFSKCDRQNVSLPKDSDDEENVNTGQKKKKTWSAVSIPAPHDT